MNRKKTRSLEQKAVAREAVVLSLPDDGGIELRLIDGTRTRARVAVPTYAPSVGDRVLSLEGEESTWIVGVIHAAQMVLRTPAGASVRVEGDRISVQDEAGGLLLEHDASARQTRIARPEGELSIEAGRVRIAGEQIDLEARGSVRTRAAERIDHVGRWELRAQRVLQQCVDVYREIEGVEATRAGRVRMLVKGVMRVFADRSEIASRQDTVIDGKRVLLG